MARNSEKSVRTGHQSRASANASRTSVSKPKQYKAGQSAGRSAQPERADSARWTFFSNHAHVLICLYQDSEMVLRNIANRVGITERAVQSIIQDLEDAGFVKRERVGRQNHYQVIHDKHLRHPIEEHCTVDMLFDVILENS